MRRASRVRVRRRRRPGGVGPDTSFAIRPNDLWCWGLTDLRAEIPLEPLQPEVLAWHLTESLRSDEVQTDWDRALAQEGLLEGPRLLYPKSLSDRGTQNLTHTRRATAEQIAP